jgi:hypothetical protein
MKKDSHIIARLIYQHRPFEAGEDRNPLNPDTR